MSHGDAMNTKQKIWDVSFKLMTEGPTRRFHDITVHDICIATGYHRSTFYRHFDSKFELFEFGIMQLWDTYFQTLTLETLSIPFTTSQSFFINSAAQFLIQKQNSDLEFLKNAKRVLLKKLEHHYHDILTSQQAFYASYIVANIDFLDSWNQSQHNPLSNHDLDERFQELIWNPLMTKSIIKL